MSRHAEEFLPVLDRHVEEVYDFSYRLMGARESAEGVTREVFIRAYAGRSKLPEEKQILPWLLKIAMHAVGRRKPGQRLSFDLLDETIRGDPTRVTQTDQLADPDRQLLLWDLRQGCMTAVLGCLSEGERAAFVLVLMMKLESVDAAATLGITPAALKVRLSRAKKKIVDYLAPRCEHVHPSNPCRCPSRLGVALRKGFIQDLPGREVSLRKAPPPELDFVAPLRDVVSIYQHLPVPAGAEPLRVTLEQELRQGLWDADQ